ncbi:multidrug effflux MFS transporter [Corticibacterium sp. UT-5YL-CI-8]|nr:multidrug effflux MFS transporter [Tianweitania sp. UT-5YL-CI-8]
MAFSAQSARMSESRAGWLGGLLAGLGPISLSLFTPAMPELTQSFDASDTAIRMTLSVYFVGFALAQLLSGPLSDAYGRKPISLIFLSIYLLGSVSALFSPNVELLIASRLIQGIGAAAGVVIARAIVRDLFTGDTSARVLNLTSLILGAGPAIAPTIGGVAMLVAGWQAIFVLMVLMGISSVVVIHYWLLETRVHRGEGIDFTSVVLEYRKILRTPFFFWSSLTIAGAVGTFYTQSTVLSFIVMGQLGFTAGQFGFLMLIVSGSYFLGAMAVRFLIPRTGAFRLVPYGLSVLVLASLAAAFQLLSREPQLLAVMVPVGLMILAGAFILPAMYTASLAAFPENAGAASSMSGFMVMTVGLIGSIAVGLVPNPSHGLGLIEPVMALISLASWLIWRQCAQPTFDHKPD